MKRRRVLQSMLAAPLVAAAPVPVFAQSAAPAATPPSDKLLVATVSPESVADGVARFFTHEQYAALEQLCALILPAAEGRPGAKEAQVPAFLDFLIQSSPADRQTLYRQGLDRFRALSSKGAATALAPLRDAWTYNGPTDSYAKFLLAAKDDILQATMNSREWAMATSTGRMRTGMGYYWLPLE